MMQHFASFPHVKQVITAGLDGLIFYFDAADKEKVNLLVSGYFATIQQAAPAWLKALLPSFDSLVVVFDPACIDNHGVYQYVRHLSITDNNVKPANVHDIPVWYGAPEANDIALVARHCQITAQEVIQLHCDNVYRVYAVGFSPGFAYLGDTPEKLNMPRLATPRTKVPAGAVAIADQQTAIYPQVSPGGWHLLGLSPVTLFDINQQTPGLMQVGDTVRFYAIDEDEFRGRQHDN